MTKNIILLAFSFFMLSSCVSKKIYTDLENRYAALKKENRQLSDEKSALTKSLANAHNELAALQKNYDAVLAQRDDLQADLNTAKSSLDNLQESYLALEKNSSSALEENAQKNRELLAQLETKEQALAAENARLEKLKQDMDARAQRIAELENIIASKDAAMNKLKNAISEALTNFEGKGLTVEQRDGKVYVSMENKLLFESGSWAVGKNGHQAIEQLGNVLAQNPDIAVLIEGHTDNVPYTGSAQLSGNWDLSTKRATAIVEILMQNPSINPENLTAAGRGEYAPLASNDTAEGKAKNRRIEIILTPKLDEISKLLND